MPKISGFLVMAALAWVVVSCAPVVVSPKAELDTPARHVENGIKLLNVNKVEDAFREFSRAKELDPTHAPAYVGLGFCYGLMGNYEMGINNMQEAQNYMRE
jgi:Flp pilus assembly protein TadD